MKVVFDTSILVAAAVASHPRHQEAAILLQKVRNHEHNGFLSAHTLAELYSVLTKIPLRERIAPSEVLSLIQALRGFLTVINCNEQTYDLAIRRCAARHLTSGVVFDALHLVAAESIDADVIATFNVNDFERLQDKATPRISESF